MAHTLKSSTRTRRCRRDLCWNSVTRSPALREYPVFDQLVDRWPLLQASARRHLTHVDLTRGEQAWRADDEEVRSGLLSHAPRWDDSRLNTPETTPPSIPTNSATGPTRNREDTNCCNQIAPPGQPEWQFYRTPRQDMDPRKADRH
jgi:hypothetical protein